MDNCPRIIAYNHNRTTLCWRLLNSPVLTCIFLTSAFLCVLFGFLLSATREANPACICQASAEGDPDPAAYCIVASENATYDADPIVDRFRRYLRIRTDHPNPNYCCAVLYLQQVVNSIGGLEMKEVTFAASPSVYKPLLIVTWEGSNSSLPSILLNSHMDVVQADPWAWTHHPFCAFMDQNGDIYARGAQDCKDSGMMYLEAIRNLRTQSYIPTRTIHVTFTPDEEIGGDEGFKAFASSQHFRDLNVGVALDGGGVSSEDFFQYYNGEKATWWLTIIASGHPTLGAFMINNGALENLFKSIDLITEYRQTLLDKLAAGAHEGDLTSITPTYLNAGITTATGYVGNIQPGEATAGFDIQVSPSDPEDPTALLDRITREWAPANRNMSYEFLQFNELVPITLANESNPWWGLLVDAVNRSGHNLSDPLICRGATDMRHLRSLGVPCFNFSPVSKTIDRLHADDEYLNAGVYLAGIPVLEEIVKAFASFTGSYESDDVSKPRDVLEWVR